MSCENPREKLNVQAKPSPTEPWWKAFDVFIKDKPSASNGPAPQLYLRPGASSLRLFAEACNGTEPDQHLRQTRRPAHVSVSHQRLRTSARPPLSPRRTAAPSTCAQGHGRHHGWHGTTRPPRFRAEVHRPRLLDKDKHKKITYSNTILTIQHAACFSMFQTGYSRPPGLRHTLDMSSMVRSSDLRLFCVFRTKRAPQTKIHDEYPILSPFY